MDINELRAILDNLSFRKSCVDMGWTWEIEPINTGFLINTTFQRPDTHTGVIGTGRGRKWFISEHASETGVVMTCLAACKMIVEHELMEAFQYKGKQVVNPHKTLPELVYPEMLP